MQSMIKRKVDISLNAHVEMIQQIVLDAYTLNKERHVDKSRRDMVFSPGNMLYYRMLRQTGHTAALKKLLSYDFQTSNGVYVFGIFHSERERDNFFKPSHDVTTGKEFPAPDIEKESNTSVISKWYTAKSISESNIIIFSDTLHDSKRLAAAQEMIYSNPNSFPKLGLVLFLG